MHLPKKMNDFKIKNVFFYKITVSLNPYKCRNIMNLYKSINKHPSKTLFFSIFKVPSAENKHLKKRLNSIFKQKQPFAMGYFRNNYCIKTHYNSTYLYL